MRLVNTCVHISSSVSEVGTTTNDSKEFKYEIVVHTHPWLKRTLFQYGTIPYRLPRCLVGEYGGVVSQVRCDESRLEGPRLVRT